VKKTQPPPTMDRIILVIVDGLVCGATMNQWHLYQRINLSQVLLDHGKNCSNRNTINEQYYLLLPKVNLTISFLDLHHLPKKVSSFFFQFVSVQYPVVWDFNFILKLTILSYTHVSTYWCVRKTFVVILLTFIIVCNNCHYVEHCSHFNTKGLIYNNIFIMLTIKLYNTNNHMNIIFIKLMYIV